MKFKNIIFLIVLSVHTINADSQQTKHEKDMHATIVIEAYLLLEKKYRQGGGNPEDLSIIYSHLPYIAEGAVREDEVDHVYHYTLIPPLTHFWNPDLGEDHKYSMNIYSDIPNAWSKSKVFLFGSSIGGYQFVDIEGTHQYNYKVYSSLIEFYNTGVCYRWSINGNPNTKKEVNYDKKKAGTHSFVILGHVAHLLGDMSIPAHTHLDAHYPYVDTYEEWIGENAENYIIDGTEYLTGDDGFMPYIICYDDYEAIYYLFYTMNQISQHFPSDDVEGNNYIPSGSSNELLNQKYSAWGNPPSTVNVRNIADYTFNFCVGATASLFYWFGRRTGILKTEINSLGYDYEITNPTFTAKSTKSIRLKPGFRFKPINSNDRFRASIVNCDTVSGRIP